MYSLSSYSKFVLCRKLIKLKNSPSKKKYSTSFKPSVKVSLAVEKYRQLEGKDPYTTVRRRVVWQSDSKVRINFRRLIAPRLDTILTFNASE